MIKDLGGNRQKPKNYSRKNYICSCECPIYDDGKLIDKTMVKYELEPNKDRKQSQNTFTSNRYWTTTYAYWGKFKRPVELPPIINKMNDDEYIIKHAHFTRDNIQVPFICEIEILNVQKYNSIKIQLERNKKLKKMYNNE